MPDEDLENTTNLVRGAQQGDRVSLEALFVRYLPRVRQAVALRLGYPLRDFYVYEDIVQESLLNVFQKLDRFDAESEGRFRNWLATCVANTVRQHFRRRGARKRGGALPFYPCGSQGLLESIFAGDESSPERRLECHELEESIERVLLTMPRAEREAIICARLCGMSAREVMEALELPSEAAARKLLSRALKRLRGLLAG